MWYTTAGSWSPPPPLVNFSPSYNLVRQESAGFLLVEPLLRTASAAFVASEKASRT